MLKNIKVKFPIDFVGFFERRFGKKVAADASTVSTVIEGDLVRVRLMVDQSILSSAKGWIVLRPGEYDLQRNVLKSKKIWYSVVGMESALPVEAWQSMLDFGVIAVI